MYEIDKEDIELSPKFKNMNSKLIKSKEKLISDFKNMNSDTVEASLLFINNKDYYKLSTKQIKFTKKHSSIINELSKSFKQLDKNVVSKVLVKNGYFPTLYFSILNIVLCIFSFCLYSLFFIENISLNTLLTPFATLLIINFLIEEVFIN